MAFDGTSTACWIPTIPFGMEREPRMNIAKYGDGYEQRIVDGLNYIVTTYNLDFENRDSAVLRQMDQYLSGTQQKAFLFMDPTTGKRVPVFCDKWSIRYNLKKYSATNIKQLFGTLSAEFRVAFGVGL